MTNNAPNANFHNFQTDFKNNRQKKSYSPNHTQGWTPCIIYLTLYASEMWLF